MAIVKFTEISDIRGKLAGMTYQSSRQGITVRTTPRQRKESSIRQVASQSILQRCQYYWATMSDSQRYQWHQLASSFVIKQKNISGRNINGYEAFIRYNYYRLKLSLPVFINANAVMYKPTPYSCTPEFSAFTLFVTGNRSLNPNREALILFISAPVVKSNNQRANKLRMLLFPTTHTVNQYYTIPYLDTFGTTYVPGNRLYFRYSVIQLNFPYLAPFIDGDLIVS